MVLFLLGNRNLSALDGTTIRVTPAKVEIHGRYEQAQLVVTEADAKAQVHDRSTDWTRQSTYTSSDEKVVRVDSNGHLVPQANGEATITIVANGSSAVTSVCVSGFENLGVDFTKDIRPILSKAGCAAGACHASQHGKGGFKLSVFGFDPNGDYDSIVTGSRGRRISPACPDASLLLEKATASITHGGGARLSSDSLQYQTLRAWIVEGTPRSKIATANVTELNVFPESRVGEVGIGQQLRVVASYSDGSQRDVTSLAIYDAIDTSILRVDASGYTKSIATGQTSVMIRYDGQVAVSTFVVPYGPPGKLVGWKNQNFVDEIASAKFVDLGLEPSPICDDATFIRRAFLDAIGSLPQPDMVSSFVESKEPDKRMRLVDQLLGLSGDPSKDIYNDRYSAFWTQRWSDLIRNNSAALGEQGMWAMHNWIRGAFRVNRRFDEFVRELITAKGSIYSNGPANFFRVHGDSAALTEATSQLFMGVRMECAKCHQHPFESISQSDYYSMSAFFSRVGSKNSEEFGLFGRETVVMVKQTGDVSHPRTGERLKPTPLGGQTIDHPLDRRIPFSLWLTSSDNPYFARSVVNRYVGYLLGYGLVEPVDDMRSTNPPSNERLIDALAKDFVEHKFDLKHLIRTIMGSRLYSLSSQPTAENAADRRFYSHFQVKRLSAEPLLDAIDHATGVPTKFRNLPLGTLAIELPDAEYPDFFLTTFAKPKRVSVCECERSPDANLAQALHTINGDTLTTKIASSQGRVAKLLAANKPHEEIVEQLYLATLCRRPGKAEMAASYQFLTESETPQAAYQDLLWALINSKQFLFVR